MLQRQSRVAPLINQLLKCLREGERALGTEREGGREIYCVTEGKLLHIWQPWTRQRAASRDGDIPDLLPCETIPSVHRRHACIEFCLSILELPQGTSHEPSIEETHDVIVAGEGGRCIAIAVFECFVRTCFQE